MALFSSWPDDALLAAVDQRQRLVAFNKARERWGNVADRCRDRDQLGRPNFRYPRLATRIDTSVIGNTVNVASRLEALTKEYQVPVILPEGMFLAMEESTRARVQIKNLGTVKIRGIEHEHTFVGVAT